MKNAASIAIDGIHRSSLEEEGWDISQRELADCLSIRYLIIYAKEEMGGEEEDQ